MHHRRRENMIASVTLNNLLNRYWYKDNAKPCSKAISVQQRPKCCSASMIKVASPYKYNIFERGVIQSKYWSTESQPVMMDWLLFLSRSVIFHSYRETQFPEKGCKKLGLKSLSISYSFGTHYSQLWNYQQKGKYVIHRLGDY